MSGLKEVCTRQAGAREALGVAETLYYAWRTVGVHRLHELGGELLRADRTAEAASHVALPDTHQPRVGVLRLEAADALEHLDPGEQLASLNVAAVGLRSRARKANSLVASSDSESRDALIRATPLANSEKEMVPDAS